MSSCENDRNGRSLYNLFGLDRTATAADIRRAYREKAKALHPDFHPGDPSIEDAFKAMAAAAEILLDPLKRTLYDRGWIDALGRPVEGTVKRAFMRGRVLVVSFGAGWLLTLIVFAVIMLGLRHPTSLLERHEPLQIAKPLGDEQSKRGQTPGQSQAIGVAAERGTHLRYLSGRRVLAATPPRLDPTGPGDTSAVELAAGPAAAQPDRQSHTSGITGSVEVLALHGQEDDVKDVNFHRKRALALYANGDFSGALAECDKALKLEPRNHALLINHGNILDELGNPDGALADYEAALLGAPGDALTYYNRGVLWYRKGDLDQALSDFDRAIRTSFSDTAIYESRGLVWYEKRQFDRALADFERAIAIAPRRAAPHHYRGLTLAAKSKAAEALASFTQAIELGDASAALYLDRARANHLIGRDTEALRDLDAAIALDPSFPGIHNARAEVSERLNESARAQKVEAGGALFEPRASLGRVPLVHRPSAL